MITIVIAITVFVIMLLFPIVFSLLFMRRKGDSTLEIKQSRVKDARYFVKSFTQRFDKQWEQYDGSGRILLSREERLLEADKVTQYPERCDRIVFAQNNDFRPDSIKCFEKEVYCCQNAFLFGIESVRAICSKKDLVLGSNTSVLRWVDAEGTLTVHDNCNLGISASSAAHIVIGQNNSFRRLFAPIICLGYETSDTGPQGNETMEEEIDTFSSNIIRDIKYVDDSLTHETGVLKQSIITKYDLTILNCMTVKGHIRSHGSIRLCDDAKVYGNIFAEGEIYLGKNVRVYGSIFTQENLFCESGTKIGQPGKIKSVIARGSMTFQRNCIVYGYISTEINGRCCPDLRPAQKEEQSPNLWTWDYLKGYRLALCTVLMLLIVTTLSVFATTVQRKEQQEYKKLQEASALSRAPVYGTDGKPGGGELEAEPLLIRDDYIFFKDRIVERFTYNEADVITFSDALKGLMDSIPKGVSKYLMLVPVRIAFEGGACQQYSGDVFKSINEVYSKIPSDVVALDTAGSLAEHRKEYLYFRTDDAWTALGAYYAAQTFCSSAGIGMRDLKEYRENRFENYIGTMRTIDVSGKLEEYPDYVSYYLYDDATNEQTITARRSSTKFISYDTPTIAVSRIGYDIFIGGYYSHTIVKGDIKNGKSLMILGDKYINPYASWLTPYYENIILVSASYYNGSPEDFKQMFSQHRVTDFLFLECNSNLGNAAINAKIDQLFSLSQ